MDHIHQDGNRQWYFWDETEADRCGPYATELDARIAQIHHCLECLGNYPPEQEAGLRLILANLEATKTRSLKHPKHASEI